MSAVLTDEQRERAREEARALGPLSPAQAARLVELLQAARAARARETER